MCRTYDHYIAAIESRRVEHTDCCWCGRPCRSLYCSDKCQREDEQAAREMREAREALEKAGVR